MPEPRKLRVFLCHASQDKPVVRELYQRLLAEGWIDPWLDEEKLLPGQDWDLEIEKGVEAADAVIVCLSSHSVTKEGYIQKELRRVLDKAEEKPEDVIFIIPILLEFCQLPRRLRNYQYQDYFTDINFAYRRLIFSLETRANSIGIDITLIKENVKRLIEEKAKLEREEKILKDAKETIRRVEEETLRKNAEERARKALKRRLQKVAHKKAIKEKESQNNTERMPDELKKNFHGGEKQEKVQGAGVTISELLEENIPSENEGAISQQFTFVDKFREYIRNVYQDLVTQIAQGCISSIVLAILIFSSFFLCAIPIYISYDSMNFWGWFIGLWMTAGYIFILTIIGAIPVLGPIIFNLTSRSFILWCLNYVNVIFINLNLPLSSLSADENLIRSTQIVSNILVWLVTLLELGFITFAKYKKRIQSDDELATEANR